MLEAQKRLVETQDLRSRHQRLTVLKIEKLARTSMMLMIYKIEHYRGDKNITGKRYLAKNLDELSGKVFDDIFTDPRVLDKLGLDKANTIHRDVERIRATFDQIGALFNFGLVPEDTLLKSMWGVGIYCWDALEHHIYIERDKRKTMYYMNNFTKSKSSSSKEVFYKTVVQQG